VLVFKEIKAKTVMLVWSLWSTERLSETSRRECLPTKLSQQARIDVGTNAPGFTETLIHSRCSPLVLVMLRPRKELSQDTRMRVVSVRLVKKCSITAMNARLMSKVGIVLSVNRPSLTAHLTSTLLIGSLTQNDGLA
jgi:hypothetical protein